MARLRLQQILLNDTGVSYRIESRIGGGGFGETYRADKLSKSGRKRGTVCVKVCENQSDWHGEAFFGKLLESSDRVVRLLDSFVAATGTGPSQTRRHVLVFEYMDEGTLGDAIKANGGAPIWSEKIVRREIGAILELLGKMHNVGITHRDIKPDNVYIRDGQLVLGDFGISRVTLEPQHREVTAFTEAFSPRVAWMKNRWGPAEDIHQVGLIACSLLTGRVWTTDDVRRLQQTGMVDDLKCWVWHATASRARKYVDADEAGDALRNLKKDNMSTGRMPTSLKGQKVVLTGKLQSMNRNEASAVLRRAGAQVQDAVGDATSLLVRGEVRNGLSEIEGRKLFAARERRRTGQDIRVVDETDLLNFLSRRLDD